MVLQETTDPDGKTACGARHQAVMNHHVPAPTASHSRAPVDVVEWRRRSLAEAGFAPELAADLASQARLDLHELLQLIDRGCPPDLAARILAPLPNEMGS